MTIPAHSEYKIGGFTLPQLIEALRFARRAIDMDGRYDRSVSLALAALTANVGILAHDHELLEWFDTQVTCVADARISAPEVYDEFAWEVRHWMMRQQGSKRAHIRDVLINLRSQKP